MDVMAIRRAMMIGQVVKDSNLFKLNVPFQNPDNTDVTNTSKRIFTPGTYCIGGSWSNWFAPANVISYSITDSEITISTRGGGYGVSFPIRVKEGESYQFSCRRTNKYGNVHRCYYSADGTAVDVAAESLTPSRTDPTPYTITIPAGVTIAVLIFYTGTTGETSTFSEIQFKKV